jgi:tRNA (cytidine/uridine-2'-O-)-methyltransferase
MLGRVVRRGVVTLPPIGVDLHVVLVQPHTPWNAGSVGRTCLGYNARLHLVGPLGFSLEEKAVRRAGLDYWPRVPKDVWSDWDAFSHQQKPHFDHMYYFSTKASRSLLDHDFGVDLSLKDQSPDSRKSVALVFGCESRGLYDLVGAQAMEDGTVLAIPMNENPEAGFRSFNLSCTVSMVVWDLYKYCYASSCSKK